MLQNVHCVLGDLWLDRFGGRTWHHYIQISIYLQRLTIFPFVNNEFRFISCLIYASD